MPVKRDTYSGDSLPSIGKNQAFITNDQNVATGTPISQHGKLALNANYPANGVFFIDSFSEGVFLSSDLIMTRGMGFADSTLVSWDISTLTIDQFNGGMEMYCQPDPAEATEEKQYPFEEVGILICWPYNENGLIQNYITASGKTAYRCIPDRSVSEPSSWFKLGAPAGPTTVSVGNTLDCLTAAPGTYIFESDSGITSAPAGFVSIHSASLTVLKQGVSATITMHASRADGDAYAGMWLLTKNGESYEWSGIGVAERLAASEAYTVTLI
ncbi:hypothetical protein J1785_02345 [Rahnella sp. SL6]|uniref:pyocin knob domain-containing protein n=1 Tax=Rahnella perminowiae TaxID=2816244 RepID=UPI001C26A8EA|nr:pyocin knob domain-containing protein [Rahnella perminowiae]MBU9808602.1 hypothetical protein [Rahnella perminowiae]